MGALTDLYEKYGNCYALTSNQKVLGTCPTLADTCQSADEPCESRSHIVQEIGPDESCYTDSFASP